jgi:hypothetical protein
MTTSDLKRAMDRRFDRVDQRFERMDRRLDRLERTKVDKTEFRKAIADLRTGLRREIAMSAARTRRYADATADRLGRSLREEIAASAAETRRHFDVIAEDLRADFRRYGDILGHHTQILTKHEVRIAALERRSI